ncbi:MAG TPA: zinc ribbon domain-containing protein [Victivallales bacterium]|nr:zinc ribbon domain-containing protein [Victivallales bacterium]
MPTYQYECAKCGEIFECFQKMSDKPLSKCICCKKGSVKRLIGSGAGIIFKGSGFYETDYKRKSGHSSEARTASSSTAKESPSKCSTSKSTDKK